MRYSTEPRLRKYVKVYGFLSFARKLGNRYDKKLMDTATKAGNRCRKNRFKKSSPKNCRSYRSFNWK